MEILLCVLAFSVAYAFLRMLGWVIFLLYWLAVILVLLPVSVCRWLGICQRPVPRTNTRLPRRVMYLDGYEYDDGDIVYKAHVEDRSNHV